jgi:glycosyltransferase involved in cell wall biosynthesis
MAGGAAPSGRPKVLVLVDFLVAGGAEKAAVDMAAAIGPGYDRWLCVTRETEERLASPALRPVREQLEAAGVTVVALGRTRTHQLWRWLPLLRLLRRERIQIIHAHKLGSELWASVWGRLLRVPVILAHEQTPITRRRWVDRTINRHLVARSVHRLIVASEWGRRNLAAEEQIPPERMVVIPNGVAPQRSRPPGEDLREALGIDDRPTLVSVAMLRPEKAHDVFIRALAEVKRSVPDVQALIVGGTDRFRTYPPGYLEAEARRLGVEADVVFMGRRSDAFDVVCAADVAVSHSHGENLPLAVIEYMAAGKPIVATRAGGTPELIRDGEEGLLVPVDDHAALAAAIVRLLQDPELAQRLGARARERQQARYSVEAAAANIRALYDASLS